MLKRALTETQVLILFRSVRNSRSVTPMLAGISESTGVPLSTLKSSAKVLRGLGLICYARGIPRITSLGQLLLSFMTIGNAKR